MMTREVEIRSGVAEADGAVSVIGGASLPPTTETGAVGPSPAGVVGGMKNHVASGAAVIAAKPQMPTA